MTFDWADLPPELLDLIARKLTIHGDYIRFRAVCVNWRYATVKIPHHLGCQLPWLMLPHNRTHETHRRGFFDLSDNKVHFLTLPEACSQRRRRCGSSHGWLVFVDTTPAVVYLLNPLTTAKVSLPFLSTFPNIINIDFYDVGREFSLRTPDGDVYTCNLKEMRDSFIKKVVLSSSPSDDSDFAAVAILNQTGDLAFCKNGEHCWKLIEEARSYCEDVIYHNGLFYAVNKLGVVAVCDVHGPMPSVSIIDTPKQVGGDMQYLVRSKDELYLVTRYLELEFGVDHRQLDIVYKTTEFQVFRLYLDGPQWEKVARLDDLAVFLGENTSLALSASEFPGCKGNRIYYTDDYSEWNYDGVNGDHDLGIYNLEDGTIEDLPCYLRNSYSGRSWPPPIWVTPNPL